MKVKKEMVVQTLRDLGHDEQAERANHELPEDVELDDLSGYDIDTRDVLFRLGGEYSK